MQNPDAQWAFTSPAAMIAAALLTFAVGLCIWKICCQSKGPETPVPSAPPILLRVIDPQPAVTPNPAPAPILAPVQRPVPNNWAMKNNTAVLINITFTYEKQKEPFIDEPHRRGL